MEIVSVSECSRGGRSLFDVTDDSHSGRYYYQLDQTRTFCKEIEKVQAQFGAIPDAAQPKKQNKSGLSANQLAHEEEKIEGDPSDSDSSATGSEPGQEQSPAIPLREAPQKNQGKRRNNENPKARKEKKKKFRRYNKAKGAGTITTASSATTNPFAIASGAVAPSQGARWSSAVTAAHDSNSGMAAIAQKEVLRAIGNALLQKVGQ